MNLQRQKNRFSLYVLRSATSFLIALHSNVYRKPVGKRSAVAFILFFCHSVFLRSDFARANKNRSNALTPYSRFGETLDGGITYPSGNLS